MEIKSGKRKLNEEVDPSKIIKLEFVSSIWKICELVKYILDFVPIYYLLDLNLVCKLWKNILDDETFWKKKVFLKFPIFNMINCKPEFSWKNWTKRKFNNQNWKNSVKTLREHFMNVKELGDETWNLFQNCVKQRRLLEKRISPKKAIYKKQKHNNYHDFLISATIIGNIQIKNHGSIGKISILALDGNELDFTFRWTLEIEEYKLNNEKICSETEYFSLFGKDDTEEIELFAIDEMLNENYQYLYQMLGFPKDFSKKTFLKQMELICLS